MASQVDIVISAQDKTESAFNSAKSRLSSLRGQVDAFRASLRQGMNEFGKGLIYSAAYSVFSRIAEGIEGATRAVYDNTVAWQSWQYSLTAGGLSADETQKQLKFLSDTTMELGLNIKDTGTSFGRMVLTGRATGMSLSDIDADFKAIAGAMRIFHLSGQHATRSWLALNEVMAMGNLHSRQFTQQLGRDWAGIGPLLAKNFGEAGGNIAKFIQLMDEGKISGQEFLDTFPKLMQTPAMRGALSESLGSIQAATGRLKDAWFALTNEAGNTSALNSAAAAIGELASTLASPDVKSGFDNLISGLARLSSWAIRFGGLVSDVFGSIGSGIGDIVVKIEGLPSGTESATADIARLNKEIGDLQAQERNPFSAARTPYLDAQIREKQKELAAIQFGLSHPELAPQAGSVAASGPPALPELDTIKVDQSVVGAPSKKTIYDQYAEAANKFAASLQKVNEAAQQSQTFMADIGKSADKHNIAGFTEAMDAIRRTPEESKAALAQVTADIQSEVGQTVDGILVTQQMADEAITSLTAKSKDSTSQLSEFAKQAARNIQDSLAKAFENIGQRGNTLRDDLHGLFRSLQVDISNILAKLIIEKSIGSMSSSSTGWIAALGNMFGGAHAAGGPIQANKISLVGEAGPELFMPSSSGTIIPNSALRSMGGAHNTVNIDARGAGPDETAKLLAMRQEIMAEMRGETEYRLRRNVWMTA